MTKTWLDARNLKKEYITAAIERGFETIWTKPKKTESIKQLGQIKVASEKDGDITIIGLNGEGSGQKQLPKNLSNSQDLEKIKKTGGEVAELVIIRNKKYEEFAKKIAKNVDYLVLRTENWKIIPLENLIADLQKEEVEIIAGVDSPNEVKTALTTLEKGADGILYKPDSIDEINEVSEEIRSLSSSKIELSPVEITNIKEVGMGDRVCIDTSNIMKKGEGMLVGSSSKGLFLIHSESIESEYADPRPFRVNAGGVHSYVQIPGNDTKYLSELKAGDKALIVDDEGNTQEAVVGRSKIEKRPMMLLEAKYEETNMELKAVLQNAETIRLVTEDGEPVSIAKLSSGDKVLAKIEQGGRHFGEKIEETIIEK